MGGAMSGTSHSIKEREDFFWTKVEEYHCPGCRCGDA